MSTVEHNTLTGTDLHEAFHYTSSSDPGAVGAGLYWLDTSGDPYVLKRRDGTNTSWKTVGSSGGATITAGPMASLPGSPSNGDIYMVTDVPIMSTRISGAWRHFFTGACEVVPITSSVFSGFTVSETTGTIRVQDGGSIWQQCGHGQTPLSAYYKSAPATPYHIVLKAIVQSANSADYNNPVNLFMRESSTGKVYINHIGFYSGYGHWFLSVDYWADLSSNSQFNYYIDHTGTGVGAQICGADGTRGGGSIVSADAITARLVCLRIGDDGVNKTSDYSLDGGVTWTNVHSVSRTDRMTPDQVGFGNGTFGQSESPQVRFISWEVTS